MFNILVVEDDVNMNIIYCTALRQQAYEAISAYDGATALEILAERSIDLVVSDIMMPGIDGFTLARQLRRDYPELPVLMISAKESYEDKRAGFEAGIDDYMVKPVNINEMLLRVQALLRRVGSASERRLAVGETVLDYDSYSVSFGGNTLELPQKEFLLLYKLMSSPSRTFTRRQLMDELWGYDTDSEERTVDVHINRLRERLRGCEDLEIMTVRGLGYRGLKK